MGNPKTHALSITTISLGRATMCGAITERWTTQPRDVTCRTCKTMLRLGTEPKV